MRPRLSARDRKIYFASGISLSIHLGGAALMGLLIAEPIAGEAQGSTAHDIDLLVPRLAPPLRHQGARREPGGSGRSGAGSRAAGVSMVGNSDWGLALASAANDWVVPLTRLARELGIPPLSIQEAQASVERDPRQAQRALAERLAQEPEPAKAKQLPQAAKRAREAQAERSLQDQASARRDQKAQPEQQPKVGMEINTEKEGMMEVAARAEERSRREAQAKQEGRSRREAQAEAKQEGRSRREAQAEAKQEGRSRREAQARAELRAAQDRSSARQGRSGGARRMAGQALHQLYSDDEVRAALPPTAVVRSVVEEQALRRQSNEHVQEERKVQERLADRRLAAINSASRWRRIAARNGAGEDSDFALVPDSSPGRGFGSGGSGDGYGAGSGGGCASSLYGLRFYLSGRPVHSSRVVKPPEPTVLPRVQCKVARLDITPALVRMLVARNGRVGVAYLKHSSSSREFDRCAVAHARSIVFKPGENDFGAPLAVWINLRVEPSFLSR